MKLLNKINGIALATSVYLTTTLPAMAQVNVNPCDAGTSNELKSNLCALTGQNAGAIIANVVTIILILSAVVALFYLIWGGFKWLTSGGDKAKVDAARQTIVAAIIGLIIAFLAFFILNFILDIFGVNFDQLTLPDVGTLN